MVSSSSEESPGGESVSIYVQSHISINLIEDVTSNAVEVKWLQVHLHHLTPILVGNCYRPPSADSQYLDNMCEMLDNVCDIS